MLMSPTSNNILVAIVCFVTATSCLRMITISYPKNGLVVLWKTKLNMGLLVDNLDVCVGTLFVM